MVLGSRFSAERIVSCLFDNGQVNVVIIRMASIQKPNRLEREKEREVLMAD